MNRTRKLFLVTFALIALGAGVAYAASASKIPNGDFEKGNLSGWKTGDTAGTNPWFVYTASQRGTGDVPSDIPKPRGKYSSGVQQFSDPGVNYLTRVLKVPADATTLKMNYFWNNYSGRAPGRAPRSVRGGGGALTWIFPGTWSISGGFGTIQYLTLDLLKSSASPRTTSKSAILKTIFRPKAGVTPAVSGWRSGSVDVSRFRGKKIKLRYIVGVNVAPMPIGLDDLKFVAAKPPTG